MIKSMTGFGQGEAIDKDYGVRVELRAVNHRYLDLFFRIPRQYSQLEELLRPAIQARIARGRVEVMVNVEEFGEKERSVRINTALLEGYLEALRSVREKIGSTEPITLEQIILLPDVLQIQEADPDLASLGKVCLEAAAQALERLEEMRAAEGRSLQEDLLLKMRGVEKLVEKAASSAPEVAADYRRRLEERLEHLLDGTTISEERFLGEVAIFAERSSIDEELVRLNSHIQQLKDSLRSHRPVGRKLDFLIQEMNREVNTIGSKANSTEIAGLVVDLKSELEKIREQVQNVE